MITSGAPLLPVGSHTSRNDLSAVKVITPPANASVVWLQALTQNVRYKLDGTAATTTVGFQLKAGDAPLELLLPTGVNTTITVIEETTTAVLQYQFFRTQDTVR